VPGDAEPVLSADQPGLLVVPSAGESGAGSGLKQGRFYPELTLGAAGLSAGRRSELQHFLTAVIRQRGCPLHVANLWNALYFNYDLDYWGFRLDHLEPRRVPTRSAQARDVSLPVGGFVRVHTQAACGDLIAEVIYKEGAHLNVVDGSIEPELSGAPVSITEAIDGQPTAIVRERFVLDLDAFGPDANEISPKQYERLCRRALWLDQHGHLVMEAAYTPETAELDDLDYYIEYLRTEHREGLLAFCFSEPLTDDELREALLRSFDAVRELASSTNALRSWRGKYFFLASKYEERLAYEGPLGEADMHTMYNGVARPPAGQLQSYSPIGPRIVELLERDGLQPSEEELLQGASYAASVCYANTYIADALAQEQRGGLLQSGIHVRLDDDWQAGGIWRAERVGDPGRYSLRSLPPLLPLHLGYAESTKASEVADDFEPGEEPLASSQTGFKVILTMRDRALGRLRLTAGAAEALAGGAVDVVIKHGDERSRASVERDGTHLYGVEYPWDLWPGILLYANVEAGGSVVRVRTVPLTWPLVASDGTSIRYETNLGIYERETGLSELPAAERRGAPTLTELINRAFRLRGRVRDDARVLTMAELATVLLGPGWSAVDTRPIIEAVAKMDIERVGAECLWRPRVTKRTRSTDRSLLSAYGEGKPGRRLDRVVRRHWVPMHLRRLTKRSPQAEKHRTYADARQKYGMYGVLPEVLPPDCTWVLPHDRGRRDPADTELTQSEHALDLTAPSPPQPSMGEQEARLSAGPSGSI
jgi:hypothetical protein